MSLIVREYVVAESNFKEFLLDDVNPEDELFFKQHNLGLSCEYVEATDETAFFAHMSTNEDDDIMTFTRNRDVRDAIQRLRLKAEEEIFAI